MSQGTHRDLYPHSRKKRIVPDNAATGQSIFWSFSDPQSVGQVLVIPAVSIGLRNTCACSLLAGVSKPKIFHGRCPCVLARRRILMYAPMEYITDAVKGIVKISSPRHSEPLHLSVGPNKLEIT